MGDCKCEAHEQEPLNDEQGGAFLTKDGPHGSYEHRIPRSAEEIDRCVADQSKLIHERPGEIDITGSIGSVHNAQAEPDPQMDERKGRGQNRQKCRRTP